MKNTPVVILLTTALAGTSLSLSARPNHFYDRARVVSAEPLYETVTVEVPVERCHHGHHHHDKGHRRHSRETTSYTPAVLGGIIGAAIGNELGSNKSNAQVKAVAGGLLGASIGHDISRTRHHRRGGDRHHDDHGSHGYRHQVCETGYRLETRETLSGYRVTYRYRGEVYHTHMDHHPGKKIRVRVSVEPA